MTGWTALVPLKAAGERKSRLASRLSPGARDALSERLFAHVAECLGRVARIGSVVALGGEPPPGWRGRWLTDHGRGLNHELAAASRSLAGAPLLVIHADLPLLAGDDLEALLDAAEQAGAAIVPDRHGRGTNALALMPGQAIAFRFGPDSLAAHATQLARPALVRRQGLTMDLDTPEDLDLLDQLAPEAAARLLAGYR